MRKHRYEEDDDYEDRRPRRRRQAEDSDEEKQGSVLRWVVICGVAVLVAIPIAIIVAMRGPAQRIPAGNSKAQLAVVQQPVGDGTEGSPVFVPAVQLIADYKRNEVAADEKYRGKWLTVTGIVHRVSRTGDSRFVYLKSEGDDAKKIPLHFQQLPERQKARG